MGGLLSRMHKLTKDSEDIDVAGDITEDPRSPTVGINRTPIAAEARRPYLETDLDHVTPLRVQLLRRTADPRSPTDGISRTPLAFVPFTTNYESPMSIYSNNLTHLESYSCLPSPTEPSANVSDFESSFAHELDSLVEQLEQSMTETPSPETPEPHHIPKLSIRDDETKKMCESLVKEIIDSFKEYEDGVKKSKTQKKLKLAPVPKVPVGELKIRKRAPLSNITSSAGNTPTKFKAMRKEEMFGKVKVAEGGENSPVMANAKVRAQWDHDSTVII